MSIQELTQETLKEFLHYDPMTGIFTWIKRPSRNVKIGDRADSINKVLGYKRIKLFYIIYPAHRLVWLYMYGYFPDYSLGLEIDHIDNDKLNNCLNNLRVSTKSQNQINSGLPKNNTSGCKCVFKKRNKWIVMPQLNGIKKSIGTFGTKEEAIDAYKKWALINHGEFIHHSLL